MQNKTFAIGDVHGNYDGLMELYHHLIHAANFQPKTDQLILLGDLVDSGTQVKQVIEKCIEWERLFPQYKFLYGNHEDLLLDALKYNSVEYGDYYIWWNQGGKETLKSYQPDGYSDYEKAIMQPKDYIKPEHIEWLDSRPYYYENDNYFFVHGGVLPDKLLKDHDFSDAKTLSDMLWIREPFINSRFKWEKKIIFGHTSASEVISPGVADFVPIVQDNKIGINTQPRYGHGHLTALELPVERFWTV